MFICKARIAAEQAAQIAQAEAEREQQEARRCQTLLDYIEITAGVHVHLCV